MTVALCYQLRQHPNAMLVPQSLVLYPNTAKFGLLARYTPRKFLAKALYGQKQTNVPTLSLCYSSHEIPVTILAAFSSSIRGIPISSLCSPSHSIPANFLVAFASPL